MEIIDLLPSLLLGSLMGIVVGLIPGLGPLQVLALLFVMFQGWSPLELIMFYIGLITVSQYVDSIPAVYLGVPGETGAIPTAYESRFITNNQHKNTIIKFSALGRAIGCFFAVILTVLLIDSIKDIPFLFSANTQIWLFIIALGGMIVTSRNSNLITVGFILIGYVLGLVGYNFYYDKEILTFGYTDVYNGIPLISVIMGIYVVPSLIGATAENVSPSVISAPYQQEKFKEMIPAVTRSSVAGYLLGLIPGVSYILSSNGSYSLEKWLQQRRNTYRPGNTNSCVACETGNSVGAFSTLIPLLFFGVPITVSETLIYDLIIKSGIVFNQGQFLILNLDAITAGFAICSIIALLASWPLAKFLLKIFQVLNAQWLYLTVIVFCVLTIILMGVSENRLITHIVVFLILLIPGIFLRKHDTLPLMFMFIMQNSFESTLHDLINLYL